MEYKFAVVGPAAVGCARILHRVSSCTYTERPYATAATEVCCTRRAQVDNRPALYGRTAPTAVTETPTTATTAASSSANAA